MNAMEINDVTGFANGDRFHDATHVYEYFTVSNMMEMFGECRRTQEQLDEMARWVLDNREHCDF